MANAVGLETMINNFLQENESNAVNFIFSIIEDKLGLNRKYAVYAAIGFIAIWLVVGYCNQFVTNIIGTVYPAYSSIYAIESKSTQDDTKWLIYWIVYSLFTFVEYFTAIIIGWFPLYWLAKCIILVWLMLPIEANGSMVLYYNVIKPYFFKYEHIIEEAIGLAPAPTPEEKKEE